MEKGIDIDKDLKDYVHGTCCKSISLSVYLKDFDAGVICNHSYNKLSGQKEKTQIDFSKFTIIGRTFEIPKWLWAAHKNADSNIVNKINQALLGLNQQQRKRFNIGKEGIIGKFVKANDKDYSTFREVWINELSREDD